MSGRRNSVLIIPFSEQMKVIRKPKTNFPAPDPAHVIAAGLLILYIGYFTLFTFWLCPNPLTSLWSNKKV